MELPVRKAVRTMHAYVPGAQPESTDLLKLNTNENPYPPSPKVMEALGRISTEALRRYPPPTAARLQAQIAELHDLNADQVILLNGSDEGLALCTRCFGEFRERVGFLDPSYSLYPVLGDIAESSMIRFPLNEDFSWTLPDTLDVELFCLTRPNAPSSISLPLDEVREAARRCTGVLLVDEAYADFAEDNAVSLVNEFPNVLVSRTFSKSYSLAGLRMGYLLGSAPLIDALHRIKDSYNTDAIAQQLASEALADQEWMRGNAEKVKRTRRQLTQDLQARGFQVLPSQTNFLFAQVPASRDARQIFEALSAKQVYLRYFPGERTGNYLRITVGTDEEMQRFLQRLDELLS